jgi:hypothetical protein
MRSETTKNFRLYFAKLPKQTQVLQGKTITSGLKTTLIQVSTSNKFIIQNQFFQQELA